MHPSIALMRRYVVDYTNAHDMTQCSTIMEPDYRIHIGGETLGFTEYTEMVEGAYARFPDLTLSVHGLHSNGEQLAMQFSETATSVKHGVTATWHGISLYRRGANGKLAECWVEQDFAGRLAQLRSGNGRPPDPAHPDPWSQPLRSINPDAEEAVRSWLERPSAIDDVFRIGVSKGVAQVDAAMSFDTVVVAHVTLEGRYDGGLVGVSATGAPFTCGAAVVAEYDGRSVRLTESIADHWGLSRRLMTGSSLTD